MATSDSKEVGKMKTLQKGTIATLDLGLELTQLL